MACVQLCRFVKLMFSDQLLHNCACLERHDEDSQVVLDTGYIVDRRAWSAWTGHNSRPDLPGRRSVSVPPSNSLSRSIAPIATTATTRGADWLSTPSAPKPWTPTRRSGKRWCGSWPRGRCRPSASRGRTSGPTTSFVAALEAALDRAAAAHPDPGRTETLRRLNRTEYQNAIRDLLALDVDVAALLPADEANHGFDNVPLGDLSPTLLERYLSAAQKISRLAVGRRRQLPAATPSAPAPDLTQEGHVEGLPLGTRGGMRDSVHLPAGRRVRHPGPADARPQRACRGPARAARAGSAAGPQARGLVHRQAARRKARAMTSVDEDLKARIAVTAGPHDLGVTFLQKPSSLLETERQPYQAHFNLHRHPRIIAGGLPGLDHRPVQRQRARRHAQPPPHFRLPADRAGGRRGLCQEDPRRACCAGPIGGRSPMPTSTRR